MKKLSTILSIIIIVLLSITLFQNFSSMKNFKKRIDGLDKTIYKPEPD